MDTRVETLKQAVTSLSEVQDDIRLINLVADAAMLNSKINKVKEELTTLEKELG